MSESSASPLKSPVVQGHGTQPAADPDYLTREADHIRPILKGYAKKAEAREKWLREKGLIERANKMKEFRHDLTGCLDGKDCYGRDYTPRHERKTVSEEERMELNGETKVMMDHVKKKWKGLNYDTSVDLPWCVDETTKETMPDGDPSLCWKDAAVWVWTIIWLAPKILALFIPMYLLSLLPCLFVYLYVSSHKAGTDTIKRNGLFYFVFSLCFVFYLPVAILAAVALLLDHIMYYIFGFFFTLFTCRWGAMCASHRAIDPYRSGPTVFIPTDIFCCIAGQTMRHGALGTSYNLCVMWLLIPWLKYFWNCNPWVYNLDERYIQQISTTMRDMGEVDMGGIDNICDTARRIISRAKQYCYLRERQDYWHFVPHYPYPPEGRRYAIGMQCGGSASTAVCFTLLVHSTHANSDHGGSSEQFILSNSVHPGGKPVYRVMLWYSNPYHFLTGFVEASISNGGLSQPKKFNGGEHPMWLVTDRSPLLSGRESLTGSGMIDAFFDEWLPLFVHECRRQGYFQSKHDELAIKHFVKARSQQKDQNASSCAGEMDMKQYKQILEEADKEAQDYADEMYEEVTSEDGVSTSTGKIGRHLYLDADGNVGGDKLSIQNKQRSCYMDMQHKIVKAKKLNEREQLLKLMNKQMKQAEEERLHLQHVLKLDLKFVEIDADKFAEREWDRRYSSKAKQTVPVVVETPLPAPSNHEDDDERAPAPAENDVPSMSFSGQL